MNADWHPVVPDTPVRARPRGLWTMACEFVRGPGQLRIKAHGRWFYSEDKSCGPDGDLNALIARAHCIFPKAPVGALIGKIGGSSAGLEDGTLFLAGATCVVDIGTASGPLYFTINDEYTGMINNRDDPEDSMVVEVSQRIAEPAPASHPAQQPTPSSPSP